MGQSSGGMLTDPSLLDMLAKTTGRPQTPGLPPNSAAAPTMVGRPNVNQDKLRRTLPTLPRDEEMGIMY